jgi:hypothetical protein
MMGNKEMQNWSWGENVQSEKTVSEALGLREAKAYWLEHFIF